MTDRRYGKWAGNERGMPEDKRRCVASVYSNDGWHRESQCSRKRGHGPDGLYCKQHNPEAVVARRKASDEKDRKRWQHQRVQWAGPRLLKALQQIADGHNDPRQLAKEAIGTLGDD